MSNTKQKLVVGDTRQGRGCPFNGWEVPVHVAGDGKTVGRGNAGLIVHLGGQGFTSAKKEDVEATAARVVACWNACAGVPDPESLITQRDALLASAKAVMAALDERSGPGRDAGRGAVYWDDAEADGLRKAIADVEAENGGGM